MTNAYSQLKSTNKSLQEKLRRLQSSVFLSEENRNPGVGYFSSFSRSSTTLPSNPSSPLPTAKPTSTTEIGSQPSVPASERASEDSTAVSNKEKESDEALNFEYLRNVIMQFLDKKEMRPHLVNVLGTVLHFTPQEVRRLKAKVATS
ncbi:GRIP-domain-containing protein [Atractiella rhizophila]|nr:GRIP-domain-containing protein [Atractiella rhizophila]